MRRAGKARYWFALVLALAAVAGVVAWSKMRKVEAAADLPMAKARKGEFLVLVRCRGELAAERSVQLTAPVRVADLQIVWLAPPNSPVTPGQTVIRFDPSAAQQAIREHTAALRQAKANLDQALAQARITAEQDKLDLAKSQYDLEKARLDASQQAIMSEIQGEESKIDAAVAEDKLRAEQATVELHQKSNEAKIASLTRLRDQEQTELEIANHQVALMEVKTPNSGVITYLSNTSQGWLNAQPYKVGDRAFAGAVIAEVPDLTTIRVEAKVDEVDRGQITAGDAGVIRIDALPEKTWTGRLAGVSPLTEQSFDWPPSRNFKAYIALDNPTAQLRPGMNASADVIIARIPDAVSIPTKALFTDKGRPIVYIGTSHGYEARVVAVQARNPDEVAVKGLAAGSMVTLVEPPRNGGKS
ncbi:MAG: efflux RND transporter periplasmic adaptor subunit [Bryobacteraceae bacterium]|jgi:HlyD family secretion protein